MNGSIDELYLIKSYRSCMVDLSADLFNINSHTPLCIVNSLFFAKKNWFYFQLLRSIIWKKFHSVFLIKLDKFTGLVCINQIRQFVQKCRDKYISVVD